jgi:hypothetical protein
LAVALLLAGSFATGYGLRVNSFGRMALNASLAVLNSGEARRDSDGDFRNIVFLHQSVGANLIEQGSVREQFAAAGYSFWDQGYNVNQLRDANGRQTGYAYHVRDNNTYPDGLVDIFSQPLFPLPINTLSGLMQHEVIAFKSCYPASNISSDSELEQRKAWYVTMRDFMDQHPDKVFIVLTQPPINPVNTGPEEARRARQLANWLKSDEFLKGHPNVATYDLFDRLAERDAQRPDFNMLREDYREGTDSHPTAVANQAIGPEFVDFVRGVVEQYRERHAQVVDAENE